MRRVEEPELMSDDAQARAYAEADFAKPHNSYVTLFAEKFPHRPKRATVLDLGCGAADVTIRFAKANPGYRFHGIDGSPAMLKYGRAAVARHRLSRRIRLIEEFIPGARTPHKSYDAIICSSFLHHLKAATNGMTKRHPLESQFQSSFLESEAIAQRQVLPLMYSSERFNARATHIQRCPGQPRENSLWVFHQKIPGQPS